jgi:hypothetical protein
LLGAGTIINPIIKIVTTVAILAAVGLFIVKPILDTTESVVEDARRGFDNAQRASDDLGRNIEVSSLRSRTQSYIQSLSAGWPAAAREVRGCLQDAGDNVGALDRCASQAQRLVHTVQSDRSFALSYADSLEGRGDTAGATRVTACVKQAGFETAAMQRCRNLADELLFG